MNGLEVSKLFFFEWGLPTLKKHYPDLVNRIASGKFSGSETLQVDDELSTDHNWGPSFPLYLPNEDYEKCGNQLEADLNKRAPVEFRGYSLKGAGDKSVIVQSTSRFFDSMFSGEMPSQLMDWICCLHHLDAIESNLYFLKHGSLYFDAFGEFTSLRKRFSQYPRDIQLLRMAHCAFQIAHYGEYNYCWRLVARQDPISIQIALGYFSRAVMQMCFLIEDDFSPYWKWLSTELKKMGKYKCLSDMLVNIANGSSFDVKKEIVLNICNFISERLIKKGFLRKDIKNPYHMPWFFIYQNELKSMIENPHIKKMIW